MLEHVHMLAPGAHHPQALHEQGPVLGCQFVPIPTASVGDEAVLRLGTAARRWSKDSFAGASR